MKQILNFMLAIFTVVFVYGLIVLGLPFLYAGYFSKTTPPENFENFEILGSASCLCDLKVATIGDSTAIGQGSEKVLESFSGQYISKYLTQKYSKITYSNFAKSGSLVKDVLQNQISKLEPGKVDLLFVSIGANNVTSPGYLQEDYKREVTELYEKLKPLNAKIIWLSVPDFITSPILLQPLSGFLSRRGESFNKITNKVLTSHNIKLVDVFDFTRKPFQDEPNKYFSKDKYHPSKEGYGTWAEAINSVIVINP